MLDNRSAFGFVVQTPCGPRKSGMPDSVEMPAPVRATTRLAVAIHRRTSSRGSVMFRSPEIYCASILRVRRHSRNVRPAARGYEPGTWRAKQSQEEPVMKRLAILVGLSSLLAMPPAASAQTEDHSHHAATASSGVGTVSFDTSCAPAVKDPFNHAVAELHSFWFPEARAGFEGVLKTDPACAMAYWGIALTHWGNPFAGLRSPAAIAAGKAAIDKGQATGSPTPREKGFINAVAGLFSSADVGTQRARVLAYEKATEAVAAQNPNDVEARIFWALAIDQTALPTDKAFTQNLRAAEILEPLYKKMPNHPGLAHYIIHTYDVPALADKALPAARAYAGIAPAVPHALHMPSHTFTRVGFWKESVVSNTRSSAEAEKTGGYG